MNPTEHRLMRHVMVAVAIKLIALAALWHVFVRGAQVPVDAGRTAVHLGGSGGSGHLGESGESGPAAAPAPTPGASK